MWPYLQSQPFQMRYVMAAYWLKDCKSILEIGGYKTPISGFVHNSVKTIVIDPLLEDSFKPGFFKAHWQDVHIDVDPSWGFVCLGLDIGADEKHWPYFISQIDSCGMAVIGCAVRHQPSLDQFAKIHKSLKNLHMDFQLDLDLSNNNLGEEPVLNTIRRLHFFKRY